MSFVLQPHEQVLFKHRCRHTNTDGSLFVTSLRLAWQPATGAAISDVVLSWSAIDSVKYSSPQDAKSLLRLGLTDKAVKPLIFALTPSSTSTAENGVDACRSELERLKLIIKDIRLSAATAAPASSAATSSAPSRSVLGKRKLETTRDETSYRQQLLASDAQLNSQYKELVEGGVLDEEDFWRTKRHLISSVIGHAQAATKALPSTLLSDINGNNSGNVKHVTLTAETIHQIFLMYPAVAKVYQLKVPVEWSEQEFWTKYLQSNYYQSDKGVTSSNSSNNSSIAADSFTQEALRYTDTKRRAFQNIVSDANTTAAAAVPTHISPEVDLRTQQRDYHAPERLEPDDLRTADPSAIVHKYNRNSAIVMDQNINKSINISATTTEPQLPELMRDAPSEYLELHLNARSVDAAAAAIVSEQHATSVNASVTLSPAALLTSLTSIYPTPSYAAAMLRSDIRQLQLHSSGTRLAAASGTSASSAANLSATPAAFVEQIPAPPGFQEFLHQQFIAVTELLRHFYAILHRSTAANTAYALKIDEKKSKIAKLETKLKERLEILLRRRNQLKEMKFSASDTQVANAFRYLKDLSELIHTAFSYGERVLGSA